MLPKEEYINLLADLFQRGLCLDMVDVNEKQNDPDISDEERFSFMAADEALDRVDLDDLFDNAEALQIPDKYPEFYEYLRELQLERQGDEHGERTIEDAVTDEEVEEGEEEPELEEPHNLSTKDQVLKNIMGGEHTGNQRDSEKYRKGDEMRAGLDEERREALERAAEQERYDNERRMSMESSFEDERREAAARAEEQQRQLESLRKRDLAGSPEETINITNTHDKNKSVDDVSNVVRGNTPDESAKHNEGEALSPKSDRFNKPYDPQSQANEANGRQDASPIYDDTTSEARAHKTRAGGLPVDNVSSMAQANSYKSGMAGIEHTTETRINSTQDGDAKHQFTKPKGHYEQSPHTTNGYAKSDLYITEDINKASHHVFEQKQEEIEQITGHGELNTKSAQDVSHVVKGENYSDLFKQKEDAGDRYDTYNRPKDKSFREKRSDALNGTSESSYVHPPMFNKEDRESINHSGVVEAMSKSKAADATSSDFHPDNSVKKDETRDRYVSDSYESAGQMDAGKTYGNAYGNSEQSSSSPDISGRKSHLYEAEDNLTNRNAERVGPKLRTENTNEDEHTKDEYAASGNSGGKRIERYDVEQHKTASELPRESKSVYGENSSSA